MGQTCGRHGANMGQTCGKHGANMWQICGRPTPSRYPIPLPSSTPHIPAPSSFPHLTCHMFLLPYKRGSHRVTKTHDDPYRSKPPNLLLIPFPTNKQTTSNMFLVTHYSQQYTHGECVYTRGDTEDIKSSVYVCVWVEEALMNE